MRMLPVGITSTSITLRSPRRMMAPSTVILGDLLERNVEVFAAFGAGPEKVRRFFFNCGFSHNRVFSKCLPK